MLEAPIKNDRLLATFLDLLQVKATSCHEAQMAQKLTILLQDMGCTVRVDSAGMQIAGNTGNLIATLPGTLDAPPLLFCAHMDTVQPTDTLQVQRHDGQITSDGTTILGADDRAGIAAILEMLHAVLDAELPHPTLEIAFTIAEEIGVMGSMVMDYAPITARVGFVPDSSGAVGRIITQAPAQVHLDITVHGKSAHAGMAPEDGISAIVIAAQAISRMTLGRVDDETTANIGTISGGKATNIIPDVVEMEGEARSRNPQKLTTQVEHMRFCLQLAAEQAGGSVDVDVSDVYPAFNLSSESRAVILAQQAAWNLGIPSLVMATGGGSDANFLNQHGIESVILSTGYHNPHGLNEYQDEAELIRLTEWLYEIVRIAGA